MVAVEAEKPSPVDTFEGRVHRICCHAEQQEDCHLSRPKLLEECSCYKVGWGGNRNNKVEGSLT